MTKPVAVIVGVGDGLSASLARLLAAEGHALTLAARDTAKLDALARETGARAVALDARDPAAMARLFDDLPEVPRVAVYNPSQRVRGPVTDLDPDAIARAYLDLIRQDRSAWSDEITLRPWVERF